MILLSEMYPIQGEEWFSAIMFILALFLLFRMSMRDRNN